jgi:diguanylate cyclase (GGDEF)-like protein
MTGPAGPIALGLLTVAVIGLLDWASGWELSLSLFYALPIFVVSSRSGAAAGVAIASAASLAWALSDAYAGRSYSTPWLPWWNVVTRLGFFLIVVVLSATRSALEDERERARTDGLTGILNRDGFLELARREVERSRRYGHTLSLAYIDCDNFKAVNDSGGHAAGNALLRRVARTLTGSLRAIDVAGRLGGDEFALLMAETGPDQAREVANRVRESLLAAMRRRGWPVTFSLGVVTFRPPPPAVETILRRADELMYEAKGAGKDNIAHRVEEPGEHAGAQLRRLDAGDTE